LNRTSRLTSKHAFFLKGIKSTGDTLSLSTLCRLSSALGDQVFLKIFSSDRSLFAIRESTMGYGSVQSPTVGTNRRDSRDSDTGSGVNASSPVLSQREASPEPTDSNGKPCSRWQRLQLLYQENIGLFFVFLAQIFASIVCCFFSNCDCISADAN
jgi:hypothetical protein